MTVGLADAADLIGKSETHVLSLVKAGFIPKAGRGLYRPTDVARGALAFRDAEDRRSSQTEETRRLQAARARAVELRNDQIEGRLVKASDAVLIVGEIFDTWASELIGVPAASTRDLGLREDIERALGQANERANARVQKLAEDVGAGRGIRFENDEDTEN